MLRAVQTLVDDGIAQPILIGRRDGDRASGCARWACAWTCDETRAGARPRQRRRRVRAAAGRVPAAGRPPRRAAGRGGPAAAHPHRPVAAAMLLHAGPGRCGDLRRQRRLVAAHGIRAADHPAPPGVSARIYALSCLILQAGALFICDTHMNVDPTAEQIAEMTRAGRRGGARLRHRPEGGAAVAFQLRRQQLAQRRARCARRWR